MLDHNPEFFCFRFTGICGPVHDPVQLEMVSLFPSITVIKDSLII